MEQIIDEGVDLALRKQSSHQQCPTHEMSPFAKGKSSVTSIEHAPTATAPAPATTNPGSPENRPH
jgi:hypothetical protein